MANSAIVGMLRAVLVADTAQFDTAMKKSAGSVDDFGKATERATANVAKRLGGEKLIKEANAIAEALKKDGLMLRLTAEEAAGLDKTLGRAVAKLEALGRSSDATGLKQTQASLKQIGDQGQKTAGIFDSLGAKLTAAFSVGLLVDRAVMSIIGFGREAVRSAGDINDMSVKLGVSTDAVQEWTFAASRSGATMEDVSRAVTQMNDRLANGQASTVSALKLAGLEFTAIRSMKPEEAFNAITKAIADIADPMTQTRVAMDLFGKSGAEMLASIKAGMTEQMSLAPKMSAATIEGLDAAEEEWKLFFGHLTVWTGEALLLLKQLAPTTYRTRGLLDMAGINPTDLLPGGVPRSAGFAGLASVPSMSLKTFDDALRAQEVLTAAITKNLAKIDDARKDALALEKEYQAFKEQQLTGRNPAMIKALEFQFKLEAEGVRILRIKIGAFEDLMRVQQRYTLMQAPLPSTNLPMGNPSGAMGTPITLSGRLPDSRFEQENASLREYIGLLGIAQRVIGQFGQDGGNAWEMVSAGIDTATKLVDIYSSSMTDAAKESAASAATMASGYAFIASIALQMWADIQDSAEKTRRQALAMRMLFDDFGFDVGTPNMPNWQEMARLRSEAERMFNLAPEMGESSPDFLLRVMEEAARRVTDAIGDLGGEFERFGGMVPSALRPMIDSLLESNRLTAEQRAMLESMSDQPTWQAMQEAAERYGIAVESLGSAFQQNRLTSQFDDILSDFTMLTDGGADAGVVLSGMADEVQALLTNALRFGSALPEFMRPILEQMLDRGIVLTDQFGNALGDLSKFRFDASLESSIDRIATAIERLVELLAFGLPNAANQTRKALSSPLPTDFLADSLGGNMAKVNESFPAEYGGTGPTMPRRTNAGVTGLGWDGGEAAPVGAGGLGTAPINIYAIDAPSFEQFLKQRGGAEAVVRSIPAVVERWGRS